MNIGINSLVEEIIAVELEAAGIELKLIDQILESIKYNCKETNFMHNSVADSNYSGMIERQENTKVVAAKKELDDVEKRHKEQLEEIDRNVRWQRQRYQQRIEELEKQVNK